MAVARRGGGAMAGAVVVLGIAFVVSAILAIVFYTKVNSETARAEQAANDNTKLISSDDRRVPEVADRLSAATPRSTVVGQLYGELNYYRNLLGVKSDGPGGSLEEKQQAVQAQLQAIGAPPEQPILATLDNAYANLKQLQQTANGLEQDLQAQRERVGKIEEEKKKISDAYAAAEQELTGRVDNLSNGYEKQIQQLDKLRIGVEDQLRKTQSDKELELTQLGDQLADAQRQVKAIQDRMNTLLDRIGSSKTGADPSLVPDGRLITDPDSEGLVYINLSRKDHLPLGTTFQVFDGRTGVVKNGNDELEGKATIEVVNVFDNAALARIVSKQRNAVLTRGDVIANLVYDPDQTLEFYVYGDFVRTGESRPSVAGRNWVESLVSRWGGKLADNLSVNVDFVVMGAEPLVPPQPDEINIEEWDRWNKLREKADAFQKLLAEARDQRIPVLNETQFLTLVGYYER